MKLFKKYRFKLPRKLKKEVHKITRINKSPLLQNYIFRVTPEGTQYKAEWYEGYVIDGKKNRNTIRLINKLKDKQIKSYESLMKSKVERSKKVGNFQRLKKC